MEGSCVVLGGLVEFEDEQLVGEIKKEERDKCDGDEYGNHTTKRKCDKEGGNQKGIPFSNWENIAIIELKIFLFSFAGSCRSVTSSIPALPETLQDERKDELSNWSSNIEDESHNYDRAYALIPIRSKIIVLTQEDEADLV